MKIYRPSGVYESLPTLLEGDELVNFILQQVTMQAERDYHNHHKGRTIEGLKSDYMDALVDALCCVDLSGGNTHVNM